MTDYNDGKWHGWNGGKCPVHPKSFVNYVLDNGMGGATAVSIDWSDPALVHAFRVIKQHRDPREVFLEADAYGNWVVSDPLSVRAIKFREVIE